MPLKIQFVSDLHLEMREYNFKNMFKITGDVLCLAGDISACTTLETSKIFSDFLKYIAPKYEHIFHVAGNHEYYCEEYPKKRAAFQETNKWLKSLEKKYENYHYLNNDVFKLKRDGITYNFFGTTLWTCVKPEMRKIIEGRMNDYEFIYYVTKSSIVKFTAEIMNNLHVKSRVFIANAKKYIGPKEQSILITHHKPILDRTDIYACAYESDMIDIIDDSFQLCIHGHTHEKYDKVVNNVRHVSNPKGYPRQKTMFSESWVIEL